MTKEELQARVQELEDEVAALLKRIAEQDADRLEREAMVEQLRARAKKLTDELVKARH